METALLLATAAVVMVLLEALGGAHGQMDVMTHGKGRGRGSMWWYV